MSAGKTDIWMPVYIGDYLADTMHLTTEQHGAYLLLLFHLWRRGVLHDNDRSLAQVTGLSANAWGNARAVLSEFFEVRDGLWRHGRVEQERSRISARQEQNSSKARAAAVRRWSRPPGPAEDSTGDASGDASGLAPGIASGIASGIANPMLADAKSESESEPKTVTVEAICSSGNGRKKRTIDSRHNPFRMLLSEYWQGKNHASPEMPWQGRDAKALSDFLAASPNLSEAQFRAMLGNRSRSAVAHGDRIFLWIGNLTRYQEEITIYNKPASAGGGHGSRAEINRDSVVNAVGRAIALAREHADRAGQAGAEQTAFADAGVSSAYGAGPDRCALALSGDGHHGMEARHPAHGQAGADGPLPYRSPTTAAG